MSNQLTEKTFEEKKLDLEYLKLLFDREAKENDRLILRYNIFLTINGAMVAAGVVLAAQSRDPNLIRLLAAIACLFSVMWYQLIVQAKKYQFARQQDMARFIKENGLEEIFKAESYSDENPETLFPNLSFVGTSHVLNATTVMFSIVWLLVAVLI